ncbi:hypothetical protein D3C85_1464460 [compost metagenome]
MGERTLHPVKLLEAFLISCRAGKSDNGPLFLLCGSTGFFLDKIKESGIVHCEQPLLTKRVVKVLYERSGGQEWEHALYTGK